MENIDQSPSLKPSRLWVVVGILCAVLAISGLVGAILVQRSAAVPIGEGEVFLADAEQAAQVISDEAGDLDGAVRHARNQLGVEALSVVDSSARVVASTSASLDGTTLTNGLVVRGATGGRFAAVATSIDRDLILDDVVEWPAGSILYVVISPIDQGERSLMIHYDMSALLGRRAQPGVIQPETVQLVSLGGIFGFLAIAVMLGHARANRRYRELSLESDLLRRHSAELKETNRELEEAREQAERALALAEEKNRIRSEFVLMINHELRTPLTSVVTGADLLRNSNLSPSDQNSVIEAIFADGLRLQEIIDGILTVARIENRGLSYVLRAVPISDLCSELAGAHPAVTHVDGWQSSPTGVVKTDVRTLARVTASLVDNALTHGASEVTVGCSVERPAAPLIEVGRRPASPLYVSVTDDGPGIDPDFLPRVFEKFEKSSFSSGTGLGLYMAKMIVEAIEGSLSVTTSAEGSTFTIAVPLVTADEKLEVA